MDIEHEGLSQTVTYNISSNTMRQTIFSGASSAINLGIGAGANASTALRGTIANNIIGASGVTNSGGTRAVMLEADQAGSLVASITGNTIRQTSFEGIFVRGLSTQTGRLDVTLTGNDVSTNLSAVDSIGLLIDSGSVQSTRGIVCAAFGANTAFSGNLSGIGATASQGIVELQNYGGANNDTTAIQNFLNGRATTVDPASLIFFDGSGVFGAGTCSVP